MLAVSCKLGGMEDASNQIDRRPVMLVVVNKSS